MSGNFQILSGKCKGILFPLGCGNPGSRGHIYSPVIMKLGQNVCLDEISDDFKNGSCRVKN